MNFKILIMAVCLTTITFLAPVFGDVGCSWVVYEVIDGATGGKTEAVVFFQNCTHMEVIGIIDASKTYVKLKTPIPQQIIIEGAKFEYMFTSDNKGVKSKLVLNNPVLNGQILLKKPSLCQSSKRLILTLVPNKVGTCPEIKVQIEDQLGDWDECAIGYQKSNWKYCSSIIPPHKYHELSCKIKLTDYKQYVGSID
jgi:hypothetical protein